MPGAAPRVLTSFAFRPSGCTPAVDCTGVRALLLTLDSIDPLPDDAVLYTCQLDIAAGAAPGAYALTISEVGGSNPHGGRVRLDGRDGALIVELPTPTTSPTPLASATPTAIPPPTATPTARDDDDGCQVTAAPTRSAWALLLVPLILSVRATRRRRARRAAWER